MNSYANFPPLPSFKAVLQHVPRSALLYASLWDKRERAIGKRCAFSKQKVDKTFLMSPTLFRNHLMALSRIDLLKFDENKEFFLIDFSDKYL